MRKSRLAARLRSWWRIVLGLCAGPMLAPAFMLDMNESPAIRWPATSTLETTTLVRGRPIQLSVVLSSYCFFNHPSLRTGTVLHGTARLFRTANGGSRIEVNADRATMVGGREITFAERRWSIEIPEARGQRCVLPKGTILGEGQLICRD